MNEYSTKGKCVQYLKPQIKICDVVTEQGLAVSSGIESVSSYDVFQD